MRIVVVGAGGVGGLIGGLLAHAGTEVAFVARGAQLAALRERGLRIDSVRANFQLGPVEAADDPSQLAPADVVLVAVKSWQIAAIAPALAPLLGPQTFVVPLENGVEAAAQLARVLGESRVVGGFCSMLSWLQEPGWIKHQGALLQVIVGERPAGVSTRLEALVAELQAANIDARMSPDIEAGVWQKFLFICTFGAVAAASRAPAGVVRSVPETRALLVAAMEEIATLGRRRGVNLPEQAVSTALGVVDNMPPDGTASMQRDIQAGKRSELEEQVGTVVRLATESGVDVPVHRYLLAILLPQERAARGERRP